MHYENLLRPKFGDLSPKKVDFWSLGSPLGQGPPWFISDMNAEINGQYGEETGIIYDASDKDRSDILDKTNDTDSKCDYECEINYFDDFKRNLYPGSNWGPHT